MFALGDEVECIDQLEARGEWVKRECGADRFNKADASDDVGGDVGLACLGEDVPGGGFGDERMSGNGIDDRFASVGARDEIGGDMLIKCVEVVGGFVVCVEGSQFDFCGEGGNRGVSGGA